MPSSGCIAEHSYGVRVVNRAGLVAQVATISGPADRDWGMRTLTLAHPGGYTWEITQRLPNDPGSS